MPPHAPVLVQCSLLEAFTYVLLLLMGIHFPIALNNAEDLDLLFYIFIRALLCLSNNSIMWLPGSKSHFKVFL